MTEDQRQKQLKFLMDCGALKPKALKPKPAPLRGVVFYGVQDTPVKVKPVKVKKLKVKKPVKVWKKMTISRKPVFENRGKAMEFLINAGIVKPKKMII